MNIDMHDPERWMADGLCLQIDPEMFYPSSATTAWSSIKQAKAICGACPARLDCLKFALKTEADLARQYRHGIWGGLTPQQRHTLVNGEKPVAA